MKTIIHTLRVHAPLVAALVTVGGGWASPRLSAQTLTAPGPAVVEHTVASSALRNLHGDPLERTVLVYLPPSYHEEPNRRYPVVYLLHSFGGGPEVWRGGPRGYEGLDVAATMDSLVAAASVQELIVVMPDAETRLGGSWYADSPTSGDWERFIAEDLVGWVDRMFRTRADRAHRGISGQSMGAYGALRIAMRHPDVFGAVLAMSPVPATDPNPLGEAGMRAALQADPSDLADAPVLARVLWSRAAAFSPDPDAPPAFARLPYRLDGAELSRLDEVWARWSESTLEGLARRHVPALRRLTPRIEVGADDPLRGDVAALSTTLDELGVSHELEVFDGGHVVGVRRRFETSVLQYFSEKLTGAEPEPIIDVHLHAYPALPPAADPIVLGLLSGPSREALEAWAAASPRRFQLGAWLFTSDSVWPAVGELRSWYEEGPFRVLGELNLQYDGVAFDDERLMPTPHARFPKPWS